jgi:hypothetical protein
LETTKVQVELSRRIVDVLAPLVGQHMASAALTTQCKKMGVPVERIGKDDIPNLSKGIEKGLVIFVGSDRAHEIAGLLDRLGKES